MSRRAVRLASLACPALMLALVAACSVPPQRAPEAVGAAPESVPAASPRKPAATAKYGGAYYKDDGPGDNIPDNLDAIPDAQPRVEPLHRFANKPYLVLGKSYVPNTSVAAFRQRGIASWYGKKFHGQNTSIGEPYDMFAMTAAHPTLAIPSYVRVTRVGTGKSVVVRVTDRGPFHADRIIDLSYAAAYRLGYVDAGSTLVEVEALLPTDYAQVATPVKSAFEPDEIALLAARINASEASPAPPAASATPQKGIFLQLGAFASSDNAESLRAHLSRELDWLHEPIQIVSSAGIHRVHLGPYASRGDAEKTAEKIRQELGYKPTFVTR
jgi:rare lipoprotein A